MRKVVVLLLALVTLAACGKADLSRSKAESDLLTSETIKNYQVRLPFSAVGIAKGAEQGWWYSSSGGLDIQFNIEPQLVERVTVENILLKKPIEIVVTVTGISDTPGTTNLKDVQFEWRYRIFPGILKRFVTEGGSGTAVFRLFDDGWRLEGAKAISSGRAPELSAKEREAELADVAAETKRIADERLRVKQEREALQAAAVEKEKQRIAAQEAFEARVQLSKKSTKTILSYSYRKNAQLVTIMLTDVGIRVNTRTTWLGGIAFLKPPPPPQSDSCIEGEHRPGANYITPYSVCGGPRQEELYKELARALQSWKARFGDLPAAQFRPLDSP